MSAETRTAPVWRACTSARHRRAEAARWADGALHFVDLSRGDLYRFRGLGAGGRRPR